MSARRKLPTPGFPEQVDPTVVDGPLANGLLDTPTPVTGPTTLLDPPSLATPTSLDTPVTSQAAPTVYGKPVAAPPQAAPIQVISKKATGPIQAISMKARDDAQVESTSAASHGTPMLPRPKLRAVSEITPAQQQNLGHVAPPYDPVEARARKVREYVIWGCLSVILASVIALVVWFAAR